MGLTFPGSCRNRHRPAADRDDGGCRVAGWTQPLLLLRPRRKERSCVPHAEAAHAGSGADRMLRDYAASNEAARKEWNSKQKLAVDPRVTRIGHFLRKSWPRRRLPQLWNVLTGDMSLVGPRPMLPSGTATFTAVCHYYALARCHRSLAGVRTQCRRFFPAVRRSTGSTARFDLPGRFAESSLRRCASSSREPAANPIGVAKGTRLFARVLCRRHVTNSSCWRHRHFWLPPAGL